jgi:hypothetical protein
MFTKEEYSIAEAALSQDEALIIQLKQAVGWGGIGQLADMVSNSSSIYWDWDYSTLRPTKDGGYSYRCGYGSEVRRTKTSITISSCSGHAVAIEFSTAGEVLNLDTGTEESQLAFGGHFSPEERVNIVAQRLAKAGLKINKKATFACIERCRQMNAIKGFLNRGPERPATRVRKALDRWPREVVMTMAAEMWPLSFRQQAA